MLILKHQQSHAGRSTMGYLFVVVQQLGEAPRHLVFIHSHLLDFNQPKTLIFYSVCLQIFYTESAFGFLDMCVPVIVLF